MRRIPLADIREQVNRIINRIPPEHREHLAASVSMLAQRVSPAALDICGEIIAQSNHLTPIDCQEIVATAGGFMIGRFKGHGAELLASASDFLLQAAKEGDLFPGQPDLGLDGDDDDAA